MFDMMHHIRRDKADNQWSEEFAQNIYDFFYDTNHDIIEREESNEPRDENFWELQRMYLLRALQAECGFTKGELISIIASFLRKRKLSGASSTELEARLPPQRNKSL